MRGLNKAQVIGRLGQEPQVTTTATGLTICKFSVATSEQWTDANGQKQEQTEWHRIAMFGKLAEIAAKYLKKGSTVYIEGKMKTQKYADQNGIERWTTNIHADQMQMLDGKPNNQGEQENMQPVSHINTQNQPNNQAQANVSSNQNTDIQAGGVNDPTAVQANAPQELPKPGGLSNSDIPFNYVSNQLVGII